MLTADDFLNWEYSISYTNNMMDFQENLDCDGKDRFDAKVLKVMAPNNTQNFLIIGIVFSLLNYWITLFSTVNVCIYSDAKNNKTFPGSLYNGEGISFPYEVNNGTTHMFPFFIYFCFDKVTICIFSCIYSDAKLDVLLCWCT